MSAFKLTTHALTRKQQRGLQRGDIDRVIMSGTHIDDNSIIFTRKDSNEEIRLLKTQMKKLENKTRIKKGSMATVLPYKQEKIRQLKAEIHQLERLKGLKVVVVGACIITAYPVTRTEERRCFRRLRDKAP